MHRRHLGDAVAIVFIGRAQRNIPARDMGDRDMPRCGRCRHGENFKPVAQQQHRIGPVGGKVIVKDGQCAGDGFCNRLPGVLREDGEPCRNGKAVPLDLLHSLAQTRAEVRAGHDKLQCQRAGGCYLLHHRAQKATFRPRGGDNTDGAHRLSLAVTALFFHPPQNRVLRFGPKSHASAWGRYRHRGAWW